MIREKQHQGTFSLRRIESWRVTSEYLSIALLRSALTSMTKTGWVLYSIWRSEFICLYLSQDLVWSGARLFNNRPSFGFRPVNISGKMLMSINLHIANSPVSQCDYPEGAVVLLDDTYKPIRGITYDAENTIVDLHEFQVLDGGRSALLIGVSAVPPDALNPEGYHGGRDDHSVRELDLQSGRVVWEWKTDDVVAHSNEPLPPLGSDMRWDATHPNSVAKTSDGDYLISVRHTDSIYLVNGTDNSIIWQLSGLSNDSGSFVKVDNFTFARQHDARIHAQDATGMTISFLDNHWKETSTDAIKSSAMLVRLRTIDRPMTATLVQRIWHPDELISVSAGNVEILPGGNRLVGWGNSGEGYNGDGYLTEHTADGGLVLEGSMSRRFGTYRVFKSPFVGHPTEAPAVKSFRASTAKGQPATLVYVSWNGATEVKTWRVLSSRNQVIAESSKKGFETSILCSGLYDTVAVEGLDADGDILGRSAIRATEHPFLNENLEALLAGSTVYSTVTLITTFLLGIACALLLMKYSQQYATRTRRIREYKPIEQDEE